MIDKCSQKDVPNLKFKEELKYEVKMGLSIKKKTKMASISGISGSVALLKTWTFKTLVSLEF
jgi:hypothetical protein